MPIGLLLSVISSAESTTQMHNNLQRQPGFPRPPQPEGRAEVLRRFTQSSWQLCPTSSLQNANPSSHAPPTPRQEVPPQEFTVPVPSLPSCPCSSRGSAPTKQPTPCEILRAVLLLGALQTGPWGDAVSVCTKAVPLEGRELSARGLTPCGSQTTGFTSSSSRSCWACWLLSLPREGHSTPHSTPQPFS